MISKKLSNTISRLLVSEAEVVAISEAMAALRHRLIVAEYYLAQDQKCMVELLDSGE